MNMTEFILYWGCKQIIQMVCDGTVVQILVNNFILTKFCIPAKTCNPRIKARNSKLMPVEGRQLVMTTWTPKVSPLLCLQVCSMLVSGEYSSCGEYEFFNQTSNSCQACPQCQPGQEPHMVRPTCTLTRASFRAKWKSLALFSLRVWKERSEKMVISSYLLTVHNTCTHSYRRRAPTCKATVAWQSVAVPDLSI